MNWNRYEEMVAQAAKECGAWAANNKVQSVSEAWAKLHRFDWMLWLADTKSISLDESKLRLFACDCAEEVLPFYQEKYLGDSRPLKAVEIARRFAKGETTKEALDGARNEAQVAFDAAHAAALAATEESRKADISDRAADAASKAAVQGLMSVMFGDDVDKLASATATAKAKEAAADAAFKNAKAAFAALKVAAAADVAALAALSATDLRSVHGAAMAARVVVQMADKCLKLDKVPAGTPAHIEPADRLRAYFPNPFSNQSGNQPVPSAILAPPKSEPPKQAIQLGPPASQTPRLVASSPKPPRKTEDKKWWQIWK
jgi:hypothetical protein